MDVTARLAALGVDGLGRLLGHRDGVLIGHLPRSLSELAARLDSPPSVAAACRRLDVPHLQVMVALRALGDPVGTGRLAALLEGDPRPHLRHLAERGLVWLDDDVVRTSPGVRRNVPDLLGLGPSFADLAAVHSLRSLRRAEKALGLPKGRNEQATVEALTAFYSDPERVRQHAIGRLTEQAIVDLLNRAADRAHGEDHEGGVVSFGEDGEMSRWDFNEMIDRIGLQAGLLIGDVDTWRAVATMPSEVALALRGPAYRVRFDVEPPPVAWLPVSRTAADAAAALAAFDAAASAVLDQVATRRVARLRGGGVGRREVQRLAKATTLPADTVALVLELAAAVGLVTDDSSVVVTDGFRAWRDGEPVDRVVGLARAWWNFAGLPSSDRDIDGSARAIMTGARCNECRQARVELLTALRPDVGLAFDDARSRATWQAPSAHLEPGSTERHWQEAQTIGAITQGALTPLGAALVHGNDDGLRAAAAAALPASSVDAVFGSDLTVLVAGSPSATVSQVLDACAVRESGGGAVTWRLSRASVRTALDDGRGIDDLRMSLRAIAAGGTLPAAVEVLLDDMARLYGRAVVQAVAGVVVCDDEFLLVQMTHDRKLAKLGLQAVAPTVLVATADALTVTTTLRGAGYLPAYTPPTPILRDDRPVVSWRRDFDAALDVALHRATADPFELARQLLDAGAEPPPPSRTERLVARHNPLLSGDEVGTLAAAVDSHDRVEIVYESSSGGVTERVVRPRQLVDDRLLAWCELRRDEREFVVSRVLAVRSV